MRLHTLQAMDVHANSVKLDFSVLSEHTAFNLTTGPPGMSHGAPGILLIGAIKRVSVGTDNKSRGLASKLDIDYTFKVCGRLDMICRSIV